MVDDDRLPIEEGEVPEMKMVRFRSLGCYPLTAAIESEATTLPEIIEEMMITRKSERENPNYRFRPGWLYGTKEARGLFLMLIDKLLKEDSAKDLSVSRQPVVWTMESRP